ncbi:MAG: TspO/MBR family protein [Planctomycetota bacterium]
MNTNLQKKSPAASIIGLIVCIAVCFAAGAVGGFATSSSVNGWYVDLAKPSWNPPGWIFGPVWFTLYVMMGTSLWLVWRGASFDQNRFAIGWFGFHLVLNSLWSILFFGMRQPGWAFGEIILLWISIVVSMLLFKRFSGVAVALLVPYLCWVSFASVLNYTIWQMNQ